MTLRVWWAQRQRGASGMKAETSGGTELLGAHQNLPRTRDIRPVAVEVGHQPLHLVAGGGAVKRSLVGKLIHRLMHRRVRNAPEPPRLLAPERLHRIRHVLPRVPSI